MLKPTSNFHDLLPHCLCHVTWVFKHIPNAMSPNRTLFKHHGKSLDWPVQHTVEQATCRTTVTNQVVCKRMWRKILLSSKFWHGTRDLCKRVWGNASRGDVGKPQMGKPASGPIYEPKNHLTWDMNGLHMDSRQKYKTCSMTSEITRTAHRSNSQIVKWHTNPINYSMNHFSTFWLLFVPLDALAALSVGTVSTVSTTDSILLTLKS
jgi:hypothetical protein